MIIMYYELETLEFNKIINKIKEFTSLNRSKELLDEIVSWKGLNLKKESVMMLLGFPYSEEGKECTILI